MILFAILWAVAGVASIGMEAANTVLVGDPDQITIRRFCIAVLIGVLLITLFVHPPLGAAPLVLLALTWWCAGVFAVGAYVCTRLLRSVDEGERVVGGTLLMVCLIVLFIIVGITYMLA